MTIDIEGVFIAYYTGLPITNTSEECNALFVETTIYKHTCTALDF